MDGFRMPTAMAEPLASESLSPALLRIPPSLRRRTYLHLGLASWDGRPYTLDLHGRRACYGAPAPGVFTGLLLCCRAIYVEAAELLYSANRFIIYYSTPGSLGPLRALTALSVSSLASLTIILNQSSCHHPTHYDSCRDCCLPDRTDKAWSVDPNSCHSPYGHVHSLPLLSPAADGNYGGCAAAQVMLKEWQSTAAHLSSHLRPGYLKLSLVCDIDPGHERAAEVAEYAVAPLRSLPLLKDCHVRLCKAPNPQLQQMSQDAVLRGRHLAAPHYKPTSALATLVTLPRELRLRILEYTDLITPWREVSWSRQPRTYEVYYTGCAELNGFESAPGIHHGCQFRRCWYRDSDQPWIGCFCRRRHAAFSSTCKCWAPPGPDLFLICRTLYYDAQLVFFSGNRFIVHDYFSSIPTMVPEPQLQPAAWCGPNHGYYPYERLGASIFLREIVPPHCLAHLRFLELVFPPYPHHTWPQATHPAIQDWRATVDWLRDKINAPGLTVRLVAADPTDDWVPPGDEDPTDRSAMRVPQGNVILAAYREIIRPLRHLASGNDGLARFHAQLAYPWRWTEASMEQSAQPGGWEWIESLEEGLNSSAEREVMGERYESLRADGKEKPAQSIWRGVVGSYHGYSITGVAE